MSRDHDMLEDTDREHRMGKGKMIEDGRERRGRKNRKVILRPLQA
jgi:hypothetical protein